MVVDDIRLFPKLSGSCPVESEVAGIPARFYLWPLPARAFAMVHKHHAASPSSKVRNRTGKRVVVTSYIFLSCQVTERELVKLRGQGEGITVI